MYSTYIISIIIIHLFINFYNIIINYKKKLPKVSFQPFLKANI